MDKGTVIYVGNFELPDKGASANRVVTNGKLLEKLGYKVVFLGVNKEIKNKGIYKSETFDNIYEEAYPRGNVQWLKHIYSTENIDKLISIYADVCMIILYNVPYSLLCQAKRICRNRNIKVVYDCTEWNPFSKGIFVKKIIKKLDETLIRKNAHKKADAMIVVSETMKNAYKSSVPLMLIPPLVDLNDPIWHQKTEVVSDKFEFCFAGMISGNKDSLDKIVEAFCRLNKKNTVLRIIGVTRQEFYDFYPEKAVLLQGLQGQVCFMGMLTHSETVKYLINSNCNLIIREADSRNNAGFPTKFVEAYTVGVPIIATDVSDIRNYLVDEERGIVIGSDSFLEIQAAMNKIVNKQSETKEAELDRSFHYESYIDLCSEWIKKLFK